MSGKAKLLVQIAVALILLIAVAAGAVVLVKEYLGQQEIPRQEAERLIRVSEFMRQAAMTRLVLPRNLLFPPSDLTAEHPEVMPFMNLGLVTVQPGQVLWGRPVGAKFVLTPKENAQLRSAGGGSPGREARTPG